MRGCVVCGRKLLGRRRHCIEPCHRLRRATDGCVVCGRRRTGPLYCSTSVCEKWRQRAAAAGSSRRRAGKDVRIVRYCPCGKAIPYQGKPGRPSEVCSPTCDEARRLARDAERRRPYRTERARDTTLCSRCQFRPRARTKTALRSWCRPCEAEDKRLNVYAHDKEMRRLLKLHTLVVFDASSASD